MFAQERADGLFKMSMADKFPRSIRTWFSARLEKKVITGTKLVTSRPTSLKTKSIRAAMVLEVFVSLTGFIELKSPNSVIVYCRPIV